MTRTLSASQARRIALAAQGLIAPKPDKPVGPAAFRKLARRLGAIQIDSVNVFVRTHYMPTFARLGPYSPAVLDKEAWGRHPSLFEYWGHEASFMPVEWQPLFRWRMEAGRQNRRTGQMSAFATQRRAYIDHVLAEIARRGPVTGADFAPESPRKSGWWEWSEGKIALEWLFRAGFITTKTRRGFERVYDLTERVIPPAILATPTPSIEEAHRELLRISARALGVATIADLGDYFRLPLQRDVKARVDELVETGELEEVVVKGWRDKAYMPVGITLPRRAEGAALLSPFDNMVWRRERTERMFGARYRIEIYTPAHKREHGYYVLMFLLGERIAARVDLKADRKTGQLLVQAAHLEPGAEEAQTAAALAAELRSAALWQGLPEVVVAKKGGLATALSRELD